MCHLNLLLKKMKSVNSFFLVIIFFSGELFAQPQTDETTTFILVRHAEKVDKGQDPSLSSDGYARVNLLTRMISEIQFSAVYSTSFIRTMETARPVAEQNQLEIIHYESENPEAVTKEWLDKHHGESILVAGHSNTIPLFANALLGREHFTEVFEESDYENILIITISANNDRHLLHMKY